MKKKFFLFLFPILLFFALITGCEKADEILGKSFVSPGRTVYETGDSLDLTGGKVVYYYLDNEVTYDLTTEMLDSSTIPTFEEYSNPLSSVILPQPLLFQSLTVSSPIAIFPDSNS